MAAAPVVVGLVSSGSVSVGARCKGLSTVTTLKPTSSFEVAKEGRSLGSPAQEDLAGCARSPPVEIPGTTPCSQQQEGEAAGGSPESESSEPSEVTIPRLVLRQRLQRHGSEGALAAAAPLQSPPQRQALRNAQLSPAAPLPARLQPQWYGYLQGPHLQQGPAPRHHPAAMPWPPHAFQHFPVPLPGGWPHQMWVSMVPAPLPGQPPWLLPHPQPLLPARPPAPFPPASTAYPPAQRPAAVHSLFNHDLGHSSRPGRPPAAATTARTEAAAQQRRQQQVSVAQAAGPRVYTLQLQRETAARLKKQNNSAGSPPAGDAATAEVAQVDSDSEAEDAEDYQVAAHSISSAFMSGSSEETAGNNSWEWLLEGVMREVVRWLEGPGVARLRGVCRRWRVVADRNLQHLAPSQPKLHVLVQQFPSLTALDLSACQNVRNRNMMVLAHSALRLRSLSIGHAAPHIPGKPRITNQALVTIARLTGLTGLSLSDCSAITNNGLMVLSALTALRSLAVNRCPRISDKCFAVLQHLPHLTHLDMFGCVKVTDKAMAALPEGLEALRLGFTRVQDAGLAHLAARTRLTHLTFTAEEISCAGLMALARLTSLQQLGLSNCYNVMGEGLLRLLHHLPAVTHLHLQNCDINDDQLSRLCKVSRGLEGLEVQGTYVSAAGLAGLAVLPSLRSLACNDLCPSKLAAIAQLTQLSALQVQGRSLAMELASSAAVLPGLAGLQVAEYEAVSERAWPPHQAPLLQAALQALARCTHLAALHLAYVDISALQVAALLKRLPRLQSLCLHGCPPLDEDLAALGRQFPQVHIHRSARRRSSWWCQAA